MFYVKSGDLYFTGEFDRSFPPNPYLGTLDEAISFETYDDALNWLHVRVEGGKIIEGKDIPEADFWKGEHNKLREQLREISNAASFNYDTMPEHSRKMFF